MLHMQSNIICLGVHMFLCMHCLRDVGDGSLVNVEV